MTIKAKCGEAKTIRHGFHEGDNSYSQADETTPPSSTCQDQAGDQESDPSDDTILWMRLAERSGSLDFWTSPGEDVYTEDDGTPI